MNGTIKRWLLPVHRWVGLTVGLVVTIVALTGAMMMFRPQIEPLMDGGLLSVPQCEGRASLDAMAAQTRQIHPAGEIDFVHVSYPDVGASRSPSTWIRFIDKETYYFNPCTGALLGSQNRYKGVFGTMEKIHRFRFMPNGSLVTGASALIFALITVLAGLFVWAPTKLKNWRKAARFNPKLRGTARRVNMHRVIGVFVAPIVLLSALTGLPQAFGWYKNVVYRVAGSAPPEGPPKSMVIAGGQRLTMDDLLERGLALAPAPEEIQLRYPRKPADSIEGFLIERGAPHENARSPFYLDAYSGKVLSFVPYAQSSAGHRLYFWTLTWHQGLAGGLLTQILVFAGAVGLVVLAWTGIGNYLRRKLKRARPAPSPDPAAQGTDL